MTNIKIGEKSDWKPVQTGVILSTTSVLTLSESLLNNELQFLLTGRLTQDCIENLFSVVRSKNSIPSPREFKYALKSITAAQYLKSTNTSNYDADDRTYLADLLPTAVRPPDPEEELTELEDLPALTQLDNLTDDEEASLYYLAGYCVQSLAKLKQICGKCMEWAKDTTEYPYSILVLLKNYKEGALFQCNETIFSAVKKWELTLRQLESQLKTPNVKELFLAHCRKVKIVKPNLQCHSIMDKLMSKYVTVRIHFMCRKLNSTASETAVPMGSRSSAMRALADRC